MPWLVLLWRAEREDFLFGTQKSHKAAAKGCALARRDGAVVVRVPEDHQVKATYTQEEVVRLKSGKTLAQSDAP